MRQLCWIGAVAAAAVAHESLWAASAGGLVHADAWAVTPALAQTAAACRIIWAGLLLATGMITNIGFRHGRRPAGHRPGQSRDRVAGTVAVVDRRSGETERGVAVGDEQERVRLDA